MGSRVWGLGAEIWGLGFGISGLGYRLVKGEHIGVCRDICSLGVNSWLYSGCVPPAQEKVVPGAGASLHLSPCSARI